MIDGQLRRVVMFPDDGHPDLASAVSNSPATPATRSSSGTRTRLDLHAGPAVHRHDDLRARRATRITTIELPRHVSLPPKR